MFARRWIAYAAAGLLAVALIPAVSMAKSHSTHRVVAAHRKTIKPAAHKPVKHAAKHSTKKAASKKKVHHRVHRKHRLTHKPKATVKKTTAVSVPPAPATKMF